MTDIFISYSRKDSEFMRRLHESLKAHERDVWVDWEDIPLTADWWQEICTAIEAAHSFAFLITPDSISSDICRKEIEHAVAYNKRFIPILVRDISHMDKTLVHPAVETHNWIMFKDVDFDNAVKRLISAIDTDLSYVRQHTRLLIRAKEWETRGHNADFLLSDSELNEYAAWMAASRTAEPKASELQLEYILASQTARAYRQRRRFTLAIVALVVVFFFIALAFFQQQQLASTNATSTAARVANQMTGTADRASILATGTADRGNVLATNTADRATFQARETERALQETQIAELRFAQETQVAEKTQAFLSKQADSIQRVTEVAQRVSFDSTLAAQSTAIALNQTQVADAQATGQSAVGTLSIIIPQQTQLADSIATLSVIATDAYYVQQTDVFVALAPTSEPVALPSLAGTDNVSATGETAGDSFTATPSPSMTPSPSPSPTLTSTFTPTLTLTPSPTPIEQISGEWWVSPAGSDENPCYNPVVPCASINAAIALAQPGDVINLAHGVYNETLLLEKDVAIFGESVDLTVINGAGAGSVITIATDVIVDLVNLTITGGNSTTDGGGILNFGDLYAENLFIYSNIAAENGGGIANYNVATLVNLDLDSNSARVDGAIYHSPDAEFEEDGILVSNNTETISTVQSIETCPVIVQDALSIINNVCEGLGRNEVCYGHGPIFAQVNAGAIFSQQGDVIDLTDLQSLQLAPLNEQDLEWGIAVLNAQANLPGVLPGQSITFVLMGSTQATEQIAVEQVLVTTSANSNLRQGPGLNFQRLTGEPILAETTLPADAISEDGLWVRVTYNGLTGWVSKSLLNHEFNAELTIQTTINSLSDGGSSVNLRNGPGQSYKILRSVPVGTELVADALSDDGQWMRVHLPLLKIGSEANVSVVGDTLNVRTGPGTDFDVLEELEIGAQVQLLDGPVEANSFVWWKIRTANGAEGWAVEGVRGGPTLIPIASDDNTVIAWVAKILTQVIEVVPTTTIHIFATPDGQGEIATILNGVPLQAQAISADGAWIQVLYDQGSGWVERDKLDSSADFEALPLDGSVLEPDLAEQLAGSAAQTDAIEIYYLQTGLGGLVCNPLPEGTTLDDILTSSQVSGRDSSSNITTEETIIEEEIIEEEGD